ncbi:MAG: hypothetical protein WA324_16885 [Bryobacteraceae bacterium]
MIAFDDGEISGWLLKLAENPSGQFLDALSEAVLKATDEDHCIIRPALIQLKRKYSRLGRSAETESDSRTRRNRDS